MDWLRLCRALDAEHIEQVEERLSAHYAGKLKELSQADWEQVALHETWLRDPSLAIPFREGTVTRSTGDGGEVGRSNN